MGAKRYNILLRFTNERHGLLPVPEFWKYCVCCNRPTKEVLHARLGNQDQVSLSMPIMLPTCEGCYHHVHWENQLAVKVAGFSGGLGIVLAFLWIFGAKLGELKWGSLLALLLPAYFAWEHWDVRRRGGDGHHSGIHVFADSRKITIKTSNQALVERMMALNAGQDVECVVKPAIPPSTK